MKEFALPLRLIHRSPRPAVKVAFAAGIVLAGFAGTAETAGFVGIAESSFVSEFFFVVKTFSVIAV